MLVEVGNQFDDVVSKRRIRKGFAQPVEFLDLSFPRERVPETTFVVGLLAIKDFPSLGPDGDAGAEFARISCREDFVRVDLDFAQQRLRVAGINYKDEPDNARRFLGRYGNPFVANGIDRNGRAAIEWGVYGVPETFVVGRDGHIAYKLIGPITPDNLDKALKPAIEKALAAP